MSEVLVVIPTIFKNKYKDDLLDQLCIDPLVRQVVVVDNGNCFNIPLEKKNMWAKVQRVQAGCNLNWLTSCNLGAAITIAQQIPYVCFLNDDVKLSNPFFSEMIKTFITCKDAAVVVPCYTGYQPEAKEFKNVLDWQPKNEEKVVSYVDGTCLLLSLQTLQTVGFLDPIFNPPGWGADQDYSHRVKQQGKTCYVSYRAMLWHGENVEANNENIYGGTSATIFYGGKTQWQHKGCIQIKRDMANKYGKQWRRILGLQGLTYRTEKKT